MKCAALNCPFRAGGLKTVFSPRLVFPIELYTPSFSIITFHNHVSLLSYFLFYPFPEYSAEPISPGCNQLHRNATKRGKRHPARDVFSISICIYTFCYTRGRIFLHEVGRIKRRAVNRAIARTMKYETHIIFLFMFIKFFVVYIFPFILEYEANAVLSAQPAVFNIERKRAKEFGVVLPVTCYY